MHQWQLRQPPQGSALDSTGPSSHGQTTVETSMNDYTAVLTEYRPKSKLELTTNKHGASTDAQSDKRHQITLKAAREHITFVNSDDSVDND